MANEPNLSGIFIDGKPANDVLNDPDIVDDLDIAGDDDKDIKDIHSEHTSKRSLYHPPTRTPMDENEAAVSTKFYDSADRFNYMVQKLGKYERQRFGEMSVPTRNRLVRMFDIYKALSMVFDTAELERVTGIKKSSDRTVLCNRLRSVGVIIKLRRIGDSKAHFRKIVYDDLEVVGKLVRTSTTGKKAFPKGGDMPVEYIGVDGTGGTGVVGKIKRWLAPSTTKLMDSIINTIRSLEGVEFTTDDMVEVMQPLKVHRPTLGNYLRLLSNAGVISQTMRGDHKNRVIKWMCKDVRKLDGVGGYHSMVMGQRREKEEGGVVENREEEVRENREEEVVESVEGREERVERLRKEIEETGRKMYERSVYPPIPAPAPVSAPPPPIVYDDTPLTETEQWLIDTLAKRIEGLRSAFPRLTMLSALREILTRDITNKMELGDVLVYARKEQEGE